MKWAWLFLLLALPAFAAPPPYTVKDKATQLDLDRIYQLLLAHQHAGDDGSSIFDEVRLTNWTATQLQRSTPTVLGAIKFNVTVKKIFISTGTTNAGSWAASDSYVTGP